MLPTASQLAQTRPEALYPSKNAPGEKSRGASVIQHSRFYFFIYFPSPHIFIKVSSAFFCLFVCFQSRYTFSFPPLVERRRGSAHLETLKKKKKRKKNPQKESGLTSTARNRQQSGEHEGIFGVSLSPPAHTHKHTLARSPTENAAAVPVSSRNKDTKFERQQLVVAVVLPVTYPTSAGPSVYLGQRLCLKKKNVTYSWDTHSSRHRKQSLTRWQQVWHRASSAGGV